MGFVLTAERCDLLYAELDAAAEMTDPDRHTPAEPADLIAASHEAPPSSSHRPPTASSSRATAIRQRTGRKTGVMQKGHAVAI